MVSEMNDKYEIFENTDGGYSVLTDCGDCVISVIIDMAPGKVYNVKCGVWHSFFAKPGCVVMVIEKKGTGEENSEYRFKR